MRKINAAVTVNLEDRMLRRLEQAARRRGVSVSLVIREALSREFGEGRKTGESNRDREP
jgi:predicted transcriptional regulator